MQCAEKKNVCSKIAVALLAAVLLFLGSHGITHAADPSATTTATVTINGGAKTISSGGTVTLPSVPLSGSQQSTSLALGNLNIVDASGTGAGWHVSVTSPQVKAGTKILPTGSLKIDPVQSVSKVDSTSSAVPSVSTSSAQTIDTGAVTLISAATGNGMGSYSADLNNLSLTVPASTYAGTYTTTLVYSLTTAP